MPYPHLVVRLMPAVYPKREICYGLGTSQEILDPLYVDVAAPFRDGQLTDAARRATLRACIAESKRWGFKMCLVLEPNRSVYIEPDGRVHLDKSQPTSDLDPLIKSLR